MKKGSDHHSLNIQVLQTYPSETFTIIINELLSKKFIQQDILIFIEYALILFAPPPWPKAELREAKGLPKPPRARGRGALGGLGRPLASLSSAFGRGGGGHFRFFESFGKFCLMTEGGATFKYEST